AQMVDLLAQRTVLALEPRRLGRRLAERELLLLEPRLEVRQPRLDRAVFFRTVADQLLGLRQLRADGLDLLGGLRSRLELQHLLDHLGARVLRLPQAGLLPLERGLELVE